MVQLPGNQLLINNLSGVNNINSPSGSVVSFYYQYYKHDPYPVVMVTDIYAGYLVRGLNLHYLPFPIFRELLNTWGDNRAFSYFAIKNQNLIKSAFRSYKTYGILGAKKINWKSILAMISIIRNYSPQEIDSIRNAVEQQVMSRQPEILNEIFGNIYNQINQQSTI